MTGKLRVVFVCAFLALALLASAQEEEERSKSSSRSDSRSEEDAKQATLSPPPPTPDPLIHNLQFSLPIVAVCIILFIMAVVIVIVMRKARYGQFCCLKPKMRFRYADDEEDEEKGSGDSDQTPPLTYKMTEMIAPPDYTDALQDAVVSQKGNTGLQGGGEQPEGETKEKKEELTEIPLDENEAEDDRAPLNP